MPAPTATPFTLAIVGFGMRCRASAMSATQCRRVRVCRVSLPRSPRSAPEQKASPAPVITRTRSVGVASTSRNTASSSSNIIRFIAFFFSGRSSVSVTTPLGARSRRTVSMSVLLGRVC